MTDWQLALSIWAFWTVAWLVIGTGPMKVYGFVSAPIALGMCWLFVTLATTTMLAAIGVGVLLLLCVCVCVVAFAFATT